MIIHLNENIFHRLFLTEATKEEIYQKYYSDIPYRTFIQILKLDPTYNDGRMGKYCKWLLNIYRKGTFKEGDFNEAVRLLPIYDRYKNVVPVRDIMTLNSMGELYRVVQPYMEGDKATSKSDAARKIKNGAEKVYEDDKWLIVIPHTKEAAILYGKNTQWCTAAEKSENMFDYYDEKGPLYVNIDKANNRKYQFHLETYQFMDEKDEPIVGDNLDEKPTIPNVNTSGADLIGMTPGAKNFYEQLYGKGHDGAMVIMCSPPMILQKLISGSIQPEKFGDDIIETGEKSSNNIGTIKILGWTTFVKYNYDLNYLRIESQINNNWFKRCSNSIKLNQPIVGKFGASNKVYIVTINDDGDCMLANENGEFISDKVFSGWIGILDNHIVAASGNTINVFDISNNCAPVFSTPFTEISHTYSKGGMIAKRGDKTFYIDVHGFELDYEKFYEDVVRKYDRDIESIVYNVEKMIKGEHQPYSYKVYDYVRTELNKIIDDALSKVSLTKTSSGAKFGLYNIIFMILRKDLYEKEICYGVPIGGRGTI